MGELQKIGNGKTEIREVIDLMECSFEQLEKSLRKMTIGSAMSTLEIREKRGTIKIYRSFLEGLESWEETHAEINYNNIDARLAMQSCHQQQSLVAAAKNGVIDLSKTISTLRENVRDFFGEGR